MNEMSPPRAARRVMEVELPEELLDAAREHGVSVDVACEAGLRKAVADARREAWLREARPAMDEFNAWVAENGIPLARYRQF